VRALNLTATRALPLASDWLSMLRQRAPACGVQGCQRLRIRVCAAAGRPPARRSGSGQPPSDWVTSTPRGVERSVPQPAAAFDPLPFAQATPRPQNTLALLLELLDASALLGAAAGAAAAIVTEQVAFALFPLTLPIVALLASRAARSSRDAQAQRELAQLQAQLQALSAVVRSAAEECQRRELLSLSLLRRFGAAWTARPRRAT